MVSPLAPTAPTHRGQAWGVSFSPKWARHCFSNVSNAASTANCPCIPIHVNLCCSINFNPLHAVTWLLACQASHATRRPVSAWRSAIGTVFHHSMNRCAMVGVGSVIRHLECHDNAVCVCVLAPSVVWYALSSWPSTSARTARIPCRLTRPAGCHQSATPHLAGQDGEWL